jgi:hypothetical protein
MGMKNLFQISELLNEAIEKMPKKGPAEGWTGPLFGPDVAKHLSKNQMKAIVNDPDYSAHVSHPQHIPVFKVAKNTDGTKSVKVGNTEGSKHIEYKVANNGKLHTKIVYEKDNSGHPDVKWRVSSFEDIKAKEDEEKAKEAQKKSAARKKK